MKSKIMLLVFIMIIMSGCSKTVETLTCSLEVSDYTSEIIAEVDEDALIKNATATMKYNDEEEAKRMCGLLKSTGDSNGSLKCNGKEIIIKNFHKSMNGKDKLTKEEFLKYM